jgi:hypothetical protein
VFTTLHKRILVAVAVVALVALVTGGARARLGHGDESDQCGLPLSQRTGGWACPGPIPQGETVKLTP